MKTTFMNLANCGIQLKNRLNAKISKCLVSQSWHENYSRRYLVRGLFSSLFLCLCVMIPLNALSQTGIINDVKLSPDLRSVHIRYQGEIGKHSAFVIDKPYRLVLDIDSAGISNLPGKIPIGRGGINELRIGSVNQKTRIVLDYGNNPVPPFNMEDIAGGLVISLTGSEEPRPVSRAYPQAPPTPMQPVPQAVQRPIEPSIQDQTTPVPIHPTGQQQVSPVPPKRTKQIAEIKPKPVPAPPPRTDSKLIVKSAGTEGKFVYVELSELGNRSGSSRLVIDYDSKTKQINGATLTDSAGSMKKFDLVTKENTSDQLKLTAKSGPKKNSEIQEESQPEIRKFKWGMQPKEMEFDKSTESKEKSPLVMSGLPLKLEKFELKPKN